MILPTLRPILTATEDLAYFPHDVYEPRWQRFVIRGTFLVVLLLVAYVPALLGKVMWADEATASQEALLRSTAGLVRMWTGATAQPEYRPIAGMFQWLEFNILGPRPQGMHHISVLLHAGNCLLVWILARRLAVPAAWLVAVVFGLHPIHTQTVAWAGGQPMLVGTFFYLFSLLMFLRFLPIQPPPPMDAEDLEEFRKLGIDDPSQIEDTEWGIPDEWRIYTYPVSIVLFALALLCGTGTATLPLVILLILLWKRKRITRRDLKLLSPFLLAGLLGLMVELSTSEAFAINLRTVPALSPIDRLLLVGRTPWYYAAKVICPWPLSFIYDRWSVDPTEWWQYLFPGAGLILLFALWRWRRRVGMPVVVAVGFFLLNLLPFIGFVRIDWMRNAWVGDQFQYRATLGPIMLIVGSLIGGLDRLRNGNGDRVRRLVVGSLLPLALGTAVWVRCQAYADDSTLWEDVLANTPDSAIAHRQLGTLLVRQHHNAEAAEHLRAAIRLDRNDHRAAIALGAVYESEGRLDRATEEYVAVLQVDPDDAAALARLAAVRLHQGQFAAATRLYEKAVTQAPFDPVCQVGLGKAYRAQQRLLAAAAAFREAIRFDPYSADALVGLASVFFQQGDYDQAAQIFNKAHNISPNNFDAFIFSGLVQMQVNRPDVAEVMFRYAVKSSTGALDPPEAYYHLARALSALKRYSEALSAFDRAINLYPEFADAVRDRKATEELLRQQAEKERQK